MVGLVTMASAACGGGDEQPGSVVGNASEVKGHAAQVASCDAQRDATLADAVANVEMVGAMYDWESCLSDANKASVAPIEANLSEVDSYLVGSAEATLAAVRDAGGALCSVLGDASDSYGGSINNLYLADCGGQRERDLASVIDAYVAFATDPVAIAEERETYAACYAEFDSTMETALSNNEMIGGTYALGDCIQGTIDDLAASLAKQLVENGSAESADAASTRVQSVLETSSQATSESCGVVAQASDSGGGTMANLYAATCDVETKLQLAAALRGFVWVD